MNQVTRPQCLGAHIHRSSLSPRGSCPRFQGLEASGMVSGRSNQVRTVRARRPGRLGLQLFQMQTVYTAQVPPGWLLKHHRPGAVLCTSPWCAGLSLEELLASMLMPSRTRWQVGGLRRAGGAVITTSLTPHPSHACFTTTWGPDIIPICHLGD